MNLPRVPGLLFAAICIFATAAGPSPLRAQEISRPERGRQLITGAGCAGCHPIEDPRLSDLRKRGPDLRRLSSKTTPAWALKWIMAPRDISPATWMPHFFEPDYPGEARAIVAYLWASSEAVEGPAAPAGDEIRGRELYNGVGCTGCHVREIGADRTASDSLYRLHGPNLASLGTKVEAPWLFSWLMDPRRYAPETLMPNLRLSEQEAADLTAFLLQGEGTSRSIANLEANDEKEIEAGREAIEIYGCYGCHLIAGFEEAEPHASELISTAGFEGHGMLGLPDFGFSADELAAIGTAIQAEDEPDDLGLAKTRMLIRQYNCRGCHSLEDRGPAIRATITEAGMLPPDLQGEGARVQPAWLATYLADPGSVRLRSWLSVRMPTFDFSRREIGDLVAGFSALAGSDPALAPTSQAAPRELAVGRQVFDLLQCARCHPEGEVRRPAGPGTAELAPPFGLTSRRLRYGWIASWLEDPQRLLPGTRMPDFFPPTAGGGLESPFTAAIGQPWFAPAEERLLSHFKSEEELESFLLDARRVIEALRDFVWNLPE
jgi:cbb3-type cytochrome oxidase cytochrome c subunit